RSGSPAAWSTIARTRTSSHADMSRDQVQGRVRLGHCRVVMPPRSCSGGLIRHVPVPGPGTWRNETVTLARMESTLPYSWYSDPEILRREQERILRPAWQYAGHVGQLGDGPGFFATRAGLTPVVVTR